MGGKSFETCMRVIRLTMSQLVKAAVNDTARGKLRADRDGVSAQLCLSAATLATSLFDARDEAEIIARGDNGGVDCARARAFFVASFALIDYLEGGEMAALLATCRPNNVNAYSASLSVHAHDAIDSVAAAIPQTREAQQLLRGAIR